MARRVRQFELNGIYHILARGYGKNTIFFNDSDHERFIKYLFWFNGNKSVALKNITKLTNRGQTPVSIKGEPIVEILTFVLMPNHYHLVLREIIEGGISAFTKKINGAYSVYSNIKRDRVGLGGVFQSRYKSIEIKDDNQLMNIFTYIHTNPVELIEPLWKKEKKVKNLKKSLTWLRDYKWSSYQDYLGKRSQLDIINKDFFLEFFGNKNLCIKAVEDWIKFKAENYELDISLIFE